MNNNIGHDKDDCPGQDMAATNTTSTVDSSTLNALDKVWNDVQLQHNEGLRQLDDNEDQNEHSSSASTTNDNCTAHDVGDDDPLVRQEKQYYQRSLSIVESSSERRKHVLLDILRRWGTSYRDFVRKNQMTLELCDEAVSRILFWAPHATDEEEVCSSADRIREVLYGFLSLHRMAMDLAFQDRIENSYGATLRQDSAEPKAALVPPTLIRIALTAAQGVMPTFLELSRSSSDSNHNRRRRAVVRLYFERIKFLLRMVLVVSYWKEVLPGHNANKNYGIDMSQTEAVCGLMRDGGMYSAQTDAITVPTTRDERVRLQRQNYVGVRTGRRLGSPPHFVDTLTSTQRTIKTILGEFLHMYRPLYWANVERQQATLSRRNNDNSSSRKLWMSWIVALGMDLASLGCLSSVTSGMKERSPSREELKRRRMRIFLYLLRAPVWHRLTHPNIQRVVALIQRVPLLGKLIETYIWDLVLYWKHPFFLEE